MCACACVLIVVAITGSRGIVDLPYHCCRSIASYGTGFLYEITGRVRLACRIKIKSIPAIVASDGFLKIYDHSSDVVEYSIFEEKFNSKKKYPFIL